MTFSDKVIRFNQELSYSGKLPAGIRIMNPFRENREILSIAKAFYGKFYNDNHPRKFIIGINPGRLGAGATGIPFTDSKRLLEHCGISINSVATHEPSSVFMYRMIEKFGGPERFYRNFYIGSVCPLGFTVLNEKKNQVNCNYYDDEKLFSAVKSFIVANLKKQIGLGIGREVCYILGKKNAEYFQLINKEEKLFKSVVVLDHPRFVEQYKAKFREEYIEKYLEALK